MTNEMVAWIGCLTALTGSALLALNLKVSAWGWLAYLISNGAWIVFALYTSNTALLVQTLGFTMTSIIGCWRWIPPLLNAEKASVPTSG